MKDQSRREEGAREQASLGVDCLSLSDLRKGIMAGLAEGRRQEGQL
jgi:hypothetical protein